MQTEEVVTQVASRNPYGRTCQKFQKNGEILEIHPALAALRNEENEALDRGSRKAPDTDRFQSHPLRDANNDAEDVFTAQNADQTEKGCR